MGRTFRKRRRNKSSALLRTVSLETDLSIINLKKWMHSHVWYNQTRLELRDFKETGRGVTSLNPVRKGDAIITVPFKLLITYETILQLELPNLLTSPHLKIQDYLSVFLAVEKHKGEASAWQQYIDSLPQVSPDLPWLCTVEEINLLPEEMRTAALKCRSDFTESWLRVTQSINAGQSCVHCEKALRCVLLEDIFTWAYVLVNSRAVYVDPQVVGEMCDHKLDTLSDEPSMALCPYLDMFNHSPFTKTDADVTCCQGERFYQLRTHSDYKKFEQVFISYGSHDNLKLVMEYGFFVAGNPFECVRFALIEVLQILQIQLEHRQYKYISEHSFSEDLYIARSGVSFNLKAVLFVWKNFGCRNFNQYIYSDLDGDFIKSVSEELRKLLNHRHQVLEKELDNFRRHAMTNARNKLVLDYLKDNIDIINSCLCDIT